MRRLCLFALLAVLLALASPSPEGPPVLRAQGELQGDVNCDGNVNSVDSLQVLRNVAGLSTNADCLEAAGDVDCSGALNSVDALRILRHVAGLSNAPVDGCTPIGDPLGPAVSSFDLIDEALAAGEIDAEQALLYTTFAVFGDSRLPPQFMGDNSAVEDTLVLQRLSAEFDTLSPGTQALVAPFLLPPSAPGSWLELPSAEGAGAYSDAGAITWQTFTGVNGRVNVWAQDRYAGDAAKAEAIADAMTAKIYPTLVALMQREPPGDAGLANNGGDEAIDIYLVHITDNGEMKNYASSCNKGPGYILINSRRTLGSETSPGLLQTTAHEFFHILEWTFQLAACWHPEYRWAVEGFAKWAEDYVYPNAQSEHPYAPDMLDEPEIALESPDGRHPYGAYLFPFFLARQAGDPTLIRRIWEAFEGNANSVHAVRGVIAGLGGWEEVWPKVALYNWNREPVDDYEQIDDLPARARPHGGLQEIGTGGIVLQGPFDHLSATYYHFAFLEEARAVQFKGNGLGAFPHIRVQAITNIGGDWKAPEDWTDELQKTFCRDIPEQDLQELVIIITNSDGDQEQDIDPGDLAPLVEGKDTGCPAWVGIASAEVVYLGRVFSVEVSGLRFELNEDIPQGRYVAYRLTQSPAVTWTASGTDDFGCVVGGEMRLLPAAGTIADNLVFGALSIDREERDYFATIGGHNFDSVITLNCDEASGEIGWPVIPILDTGLPDPKITEDGLLDGEYFDPSREYGGRWRWHFAPAP